MKKYQVKMVVVDCETEEVVANASSNMILDSKNNLYSQRVESEFYSLLSFVVKKGKKKSKVDAF